MLYIDYIKTSIIDAVSSSNDEELLFLIYGMLMTTGQEDS